MKYAELGTSGLDVSLIGLGGHEFFEGGVRGFNPEERSAAVTPGVTLEGFGGHQRRELVRTAIDEGVTLFDVTIDEEKDALGRNLQTIDPQRDVYIQTRPAGMVYTYGDHNTGLTDYDQLHDEVQRIQDLLRRDIVDVLNFGFEPGALDAHPDFFDAVGRNIERLKAEGLIRCASADGQRPGDYRQAIASGAFDSISIGFHFARPELADDVLAAAENAGMGVITRAVFMKGTLFEMADEAGIEDYDAVARASIRWCLAHNTVTSVLIGVATADELTRNLNALDSDGLTEADKAILDRLRETSVYQEHVSA